MLEAICVYGADCAFWIKLGCAVWAFLCAGAGSIAQEHGDENSARKYAFAIILLSLAAVFFPGTDTWRGWLEIARRP